jgi:iron complex outermembrane receptor protein
MRNSNTTPARLRSGVSILALALSLSAATSALAQDIGSVDIDAAHRSAASAPAAAPTGEAPAAPGLPPLSSDAAIGNAAPTGSAPALAVVQQSLNAVEPGSTISHKIIEDVVSPAGDYNQIAKFTPNYVSGGANGPLGDSKSSWRGFADGQFNITFDGIPFGDVNNPSHHSSAYFPPDILGQVTIDRGPGAASQVGYATFGGTMALSSYALSDTFGGNIKSSFGSFNTQSESVTVQSGYNAEYQTRALIQYAHAFTDGQTTLGHVNQNNFVLKIEKQVGDLTVTAYGNYGTEEYNNTAAPTWAQVLTYGKNYGALNNNPATQQYTGWNDSQKQTDMEYVDLKGNFYGFHADNKAYTYSYWYPGWQNNGINQALEGTNTASNQAFLTSVSVPQANGSKQVYCLAGLTSNPGPAPSNKAANCKGLASTANDVIGHLQVNNYRAYGDILTVSRDLDWGWASGQVRFGAWYEYVANDRNQPYIDYTTGMTYASLGNAPNVSTILDLTSRLNNFQPYIEYEWKPLNGLSITPGYKYEQTTRNHEAAVNQTTLEAVDFSHTYYENLPFLTARYKINDQTTVYAQASKGFLVPTVSAFYVFDLAANAIAAQQTTNYQVGFVYKTLDLTIDGDLYQQRATNFPITTTYFDGTTIYQNGGTAQYRGAELQGTYAFGRRIGVEGLAVTGSAGISNAVFTEGANAHLAVPDAPRYTFAGGLIYDNKTFFGSLLEKVTGDQYGSGGQVNWAPGIDAALNHIAAYTSTDFVAGYRYKLPEGFAAGYGKSLEFKFGVQNILDNRQITDIGKTPAAGVTAATLGSAANTMTYTFQSGRYIYGAIKYSF